MKNFLLLPLLALTALPACTQLSDEDRAKLDSAVSEARAARIDANNAVIAAQAASDKADKIFRASQTK